MADTTLTPINVIVLAAGSSVLAALVTQALTEARERWKVKREAAFSALYLAIALESYGTACAAALGDSENYEASGGHAGSPRGSLPELPDYPSAIEWKPLGIKNMNEAMSFRVEVETAKTMIAEFWDFIGDEDDVVPLVREETAKLGKKAISLAVKFRKSRKIASVDYSAEWNVKTYLNEKVEKYAEQRQSREERNRRSNAEMFASLEASEPVASSANE